jgi:hypothetical protein
MFRMMTTLWRRQPPQLFDMSVSKLVEEMDKCVARPGEPVAGFAILQPIPVL